MQDSRLYYLNGETEEVISLGRILNVRLKSRGGIIVLVLFVYILYTVTGTMQTALQKLLVFFSHIYPAITVTSFIYHDRWHPGFSERVVRAGLDAGKTEVLHRLAEHSDGQPGAIDDGGGVH